MENSKVKHEPEEQYVLILPELTEKAKNIREIKTEPEENFEWFNQSKPEIFSQLPRAIAEEPKQDVKHEENFVLVLPEHPESEDRTKERELVVSLRKFDRKWKGRAEFFASYFSCEQCSYIGRKLGNLNQHLLTHLAMKQSKTSSEVTIPASSHECSLCQSSFANAIRLNNHRRKVHELLSCHCDVCGRVFKNKHSIMRHMQTHHKTPCPICQFVIATHRLKRHINQHSSSASFSCDACKKVFSSLQYLSKHKFRVHVINDVWCDFCGRKFKNKGLLKNHVLNHVKVPCKVCKKPVNKILMHQHVRVYHPPVSLPCNIGKCKETFPNKKKLKKHQEIHAGFRCPKCSFSASTWAKIDKHLKTHAHLF